MLISISGAMFFDMTYNEKRCLIEDVPTESQFTWKYSVQMYDELSERFIATSAGFGMHVTVASFFVTPLNLLYLLRFCKRTTITQFWTKTMAALARHIKFLV